jgi:hypothetical protein
MKHRAAASVVAIVVVAWPAWAQQPTTAASQPTQPPEATQSIDPYKLGISLSRIRRELQEIDTRQQQSGDPLRLEFTVEVHGRAPRIDLLENFPVSGPIPYGPPTHQEVLDQLTPKEFSSPVVPFSSFAFWAAQQLINRSKKQRCEAELAEYKQLVMQGVNVAAPRCAQ